MKTRTLVLAAALLAALTAFGQEHHHNTPKGFDPDKIYQFNELDQVDLFTGGLRVSLPLGSRYPINGELSYGFTLVYNSAIWDVYPEEYTIWPPEQQEPTVIPYADTLPDHRSNAGPGWLLSFGKIFPNGPYNSAAYWIYESPDGNDREIGNLDSVGAVTYSRDSTYIRAKRVAPQLVTLEFPDGAIHTFMRNASDDDDWRLIEIKDRFENKMTIAYESDGSWTIGDDHGREHKVYFATKNYSNAYGNKLISRVELEGFAGETYTYTFNYQDADYKNSCENDAVDAPTDLTRSFLTSVTQADTSVYQFKYQNSLGVAYANQCEMGTLSSMRLPTGGYVKWDYVRIEMPTDACGPPKSFTNVIDSIAGVSVRSLLNESLAAEGRVTTYTYAHSADTSTCAGITAEYTTTTVKAPDGGRTAHYFSAWPSANPSPGGFRVNEYGLPFRRLTDGRKLSEEFFGSCTSNCAPLRSSYVKFDWELGPSMPDTRKGLNRRQTYEKLVFHEDGDRYTEKTWSNYDGVGHFRNYYVTSTIGGSEARWETTLWDAATGEMKVGADGTILQDVTRPGTWAPWVLNTYNWSSVTENDTERPSEYCFDKTTGFLKSTRAKSGDGTNDVITVFSHTLPTPFDAAQNGKGNVLREEYFGGDDQEVPAGSLLCDTSLSSLTPRYTILHQFEYGVRHKTRYKDAPFLTLDLEIDKDSGFIDESRDEVGLLTEYEYDERGRVTEAKSPGRATVTVVYDTNARPPVTTMKALDPADNAVLTDQRFYHDPWGRLMQSREQMDDGWATIRSTYDTSGRKHTVSSPEYRSSAAYEAFTPAAVTTTLYDLYGRLLSATNPDGSKVEYTYNGVRKKTATQWIATALGQADTAVVKSEEYDHRGRVLKMTEKSGPTTSTSTIGADVSTAYEYDPADRLLSVKMTASGGVVQHRIFDYDGRGFLKWESHPESGMTAYTYDPRGHVLTKRQGAADGQFDLDYQYDSAERLTLLTGRNPQSPTQFRKVKEFEFGTANLPVNNKTDYRLGKVIRATRWNYGGEYDQYTYRVDNSYDYIDDAGRLHGRKQKITRIDGSYQEVMKELNLSVTLNLLDQVDEISYPMCVGCGAPPVNPERKPKHRYSKGRLVRIDNIIGNLENPITYWPNGMRRKMRHENGVVDTQEVGSMPRVTEISFKTYDRCVSPSFAPQGQPIGGAGATNLSVTMNGTAPFTYEWYGYGDDNSWGIVGTTQSISVNPSVRTTYSVTVANACGYVTSQDAVVRPSGCEPPTTGWIDVVLQPDGSWILRPKPTARTGRTFQWKRLSDNAILGSSETLAVGSLSETTTYAFTVTDNCGSATSNVTVTVPLPMTSTALTATWLPGTGIRVSWPASTGATGYTIERRAGPTWEFLASVTGTQHDDGTVTSGKAYAYRVFATGNNSSKSGYSNSDVATTFTYTPPAAGSSITAGTFNAVLDAVNKIRQAAGLPLVTWQTILSPLDPLPNPGVVVSARHILACRARMTEALQSLGAPPKNYVDPDPMLRSIKALHLSEIQDQTK